MADPKPADELIIIKGQKVTSDMKNSLLLLTGLTLFSCASPAPLRFRTELIRPYRYADQEKEPYSAPYVALYSKGRKELAYVAADHGNDPDGPTFKTILRVFESFNPQAVIIEGVEFQGAYSPKTFSELAKQCSKVEFENCSESAYTAFVADKNGIPFIPGEISDAAIADRFVASGYPEGEYSYLVAGQMIHQYKRQQRKKLSNMDQHLRAEVGVSIDKFKNWFESKSGQPFSLELIGSETFSPQIDASPTYFNRLAALAGSIREEFVSKRMEEAFQKFDRVMVVFGSGHLVKQREAFSDAFGPGKNLKFYP